MCSLIVAWQLFDDAPVVVGANRDEAHGRPASPPRVWDADPKILAPRDEEAGGTWIGYNEAGVFAALTNRWTQEPATGDRSRGLLVSDALGAPSARAAADSVRREVTDRAYQPFHLLVADGDDALLFEHDSDRSVTELAPGVYVVVNVGWTGRHRGPADAESPETTESFFRPSGGPGPQAGRQQKRRARDIREELRDPPDADVWLERTGEVLADHGFGACVHGDGFGTRSSSLVRLGDDRRYLFADGPPCETAYEPVEPL